MTTQKPTIFSFFAGAGFLDLGFEKTGFKVSFVNEYHEPFMDTYKHSRKVMGLPEPEFGYHRCDISDFTNDEGSTRLKLMVEKARKDGRLIGFIGGPPCPDFSVGGKNRGSEGENGKLSATYIDVICQQEPDFFLFENVKGLWRTKKHRAFFDEIKETVNLKGYKTTTRLINALVYGVPQQRERIIMIGVKDEVLSKLGIEVPQDSGNSIDSIFPWDAYVKYTNAQIAASNFPQQDLFNEDGEVPKPDGLIEELSVEYWFKKNDVYNHPNANMYFTPRAGLKKFQVIPEGDDSKKSYKRLHRWRYSPTAAYGNNEVHLHPYKARRLSVAEALAIQSLPKEYELPLSITLSNAFKTVGNGVPFLASKMIAETILDFLRVR